MEFEAENARKKLEEILHIADRVVSGTTTLVEDYVLGDRVCCQRTYWGMVWTKAHEGLGLDLPRPPAWPPEPPKKPPCPRGMSGPCEDCLYFPGNLDNKGGVTNARSL